MYTGGAYQFSLTDGIAATSYLDQWHPNVNQSNLKGNVAIYWQNNSLKNVTI